LSRIPKVSIVIPSYNYGHYMGATIESILAQTYTDFELLILDDGSQDDSFTIAQRYAHEDPRVRVWQQTNSGPIETVNRLMAQTRGEFVAKVDADDQWLPERLTWAMTDMAEDPDLSATFCGYLIIDGSGNISGLIDQLTLGTITGRAMIQRMLAANVACACTAVVRRTALDQAGVFARAYRISNDWDLWLRLALVGNLKLRGEVGALYRWHGNNLSGDAQLHEGTQDQLHIIDIMAPKVIEKYGFGLPEIASVLGKKANLYFGIGDRVQALDFFLKKSDIGPLSDGESLRLLECLALNGHVDATIQLAQSLHQQRAIFKKDTRKALDQVCQKLGLGAAWSSPESSLAAPC
jgi:glycosyltransferase involved in cell wall biosynthesis